MDMHLQTKIALVTGAGAGIGRAVAVELARCGATVVVNYRRIESGARETLVLIEQVSSTGLLYQADIARSVETQMEQPSWSVWELAQLRLSAATTGYET